MAAKSSSFTSFRAGTSYLNLIAQPSERRWSWWGRIIFYVADVDALYDRALAAGYQPAAAPRDAEWGERFFHLNDPDGHELSFARPLLPVSVHSARSGLPFQEALGARMVLRYRTGEALMQFRTTGLLLLGAIALPASGTAQTIPAPPAITRTVVAATKLPTVTDVPLHFKAVSITLQPNEKSGVSAANGILYQMSGSTEVALDGEAKMLNAGDGLFIAGGKTSALTAGRGGPSTFLHFLLAPLWTWIGLPRRHLPP